MRVTGSIGRSSRPKVTPGGLRRAGLPALRPALASGGLIQVAYASADERACATIRVVEAEFVSRAIAAATALAAELRLHADDAVVIHNSNKLALRLLPCGVFARVALVGQEVAALE